MPRPNPSHLDDWLDDEIDSLLRSVDADVDPETATTPSVAGRASPRWFRRSAAGARPSRTRPRLGLGRIMTRTHTFSGAWRADLAFYALGVVASLMLGWLIVLLSKP
jgi:hypothetical protein